MAKESPTAVATVIKRGPIFDRIVGDKTIGFMEALDGLGYITTGFSFLAIGMVVFVHAWYAFVLAVGSKAVPAVLALVHDLLLVKETAPRRATDEGRSIGPPFIKEFEMVLPLVHISFRPYPL